jgi:cardiolipin synthase
LFKQLRSVPNLLTLLRLVFIPFIITAVLENHYQQAIILFVLAGVSDAFDGWLARVLHMRTKLGEYLDPIADKLLLSTLFLVLSNMHKIPWRITVLVFSRDLGILIIATLVYVTTNVRDFRPTIFGKANTVAQIIAVAAVMLAEVYPAGWVLWVRATALWATFAFTLLSALHYLFLVGKRLRTAPEA